MGKISRDWHKVTVGRAVFYLIEKKGKEETTKQSVFIEHENCIRNQTLHNNK